MAARRVLVLTTDTGAGHRSVSRALRAAAEAQPERELEIIELDPFRPLSAAPAGAGGSAAGGGRTSPLDRLVPLYGPVILRAPWLWGWGFHLANNPAALRLFLALFGTSLQARLVETLDRTGAEAVVSAHPLVNHVMARLRRASGRLWPPPGRLLGLERNGPARDQGRRGGQKQPFLPLLTVVTDLVDVHSWWAAREVDRFTVGSDVAAARLVDLGVSPQKVSVVGIPLRRQFERLNVSQREMRRQLGLAPEVTTILLMGGGEGAGQLPQTVRALSRLVRQGHQFQLVVVTGRNRRARIDLEAVSWPMPVMVHGLIENVAEQMVAADLVVTKPGSLTISEALAVGRPLLLGRPLPGQEEGNVGFVVRAGAGLHYRDAAEGAEAVAYLLGDPAARWEMGQHAARLGRPHATERTLDLIQALLLQAGAGRAPR